MRRLALLLAAVLLAGCPTREFYLDRSQIGWEDHGIRMLELPAFEAPPEAWAVNETMIAGPKPCSAMTIAM